MEQKNTLLDFWKQNFTFTEAELKAFREIKREEFIPKELKSQAYDDMPLPLFRGKTISQPTTIMLMTSSLELKKGDKVFEVGTGSGYQTAIVANIVGPKGKVVSTEILPELVSFANQNLNKAGIKNVLVLEEDGSKGYLEEAPYDKVIITAACKEFPKPLLDQLKSEGIIIGPVGDANEQEMVKGIKGKDGKFNLEFLGQFLFSPLYGKYGFEE